MMGKTQLLLLSVLLLSASALAWKSELPFEGFEDTDEDVDGNPLEDVQMNSELLDDVDENQLEDGPMNSEVLLDDHHQSQIAKRATRRCTCTGNTCVCTKRVRLIKKIRVTITVTDLRPQQDKLSLKVEVGPFKVFSKTIPAVGDFEKCTPRLIFRSAVCFKVTNVGIQNGRLQACFSVGLKFIFRPKYKRIACLQ